VTVSAATRDARRNPRPTGVATISADVTDEEAAHRIVAEVARTSWR